MIIISYCVPVPASRSTPHHVGAMMTQTTSSFADDCSRLQNPAAIRHGCLLQSVCDWIGLPPRPSSSASAAAAAAVTLISEGPVLLREKTGSNSTKIRRAVGVVQITNPRRLPPPAKRQLELACMPYVCRAFGQDVATVDPTILQEHCDHLTPGDALFCAIQVATTDDDDNAAPKDVEEKENEAAHPHPPPKFLSHLLVSVLPRIKLPSSSTQEDCKAVCVVGRVCDPWFQNQGVSTILQTAMIAQLQPKLLVTRTANPAIFRIFQRAGQQQQQQQPKWLNKDSNNSSSNKNSHNNKLFPNDCHSEQDWQLARCIADQIVQKWDHLSPKDLERYDAEHLVFRNLYSSTNQKVFGTTSSTTCSHDPEKTTNNNNNTKNDDEDKQQSLTTSLLSPGDALLQILLFSA
jgi:hypothetical protein